jgi:hypothetical protein
MKTFQNLSLGYSVTEGTLWRHSFTISNKIEEIDKQTQQSF